MSDGGLGNPERNQNVIQQGDIATRLRRFTRGVGNLGTFLDSEIHPEISVGDTTIDPYQSEWRSYQTNQSVAGVAATLSGCGVMGLAPVTVVKAVAVWSVASVGPFTVKLQRPNNLATVAYTGLTACQLNGGGNGLAVISPGCIARNIQVTTAGGASGQFGGAFPADAAQGLTLLTFPDPIVLYGPGFNGQPATSVIGDTFLFEDQTANQTLNVSIFFREYLQIAPN